MEKNLTSGSIFKNILGFSLPYLLSYFLQTLYGMADLFIIGKFGGVADISAVSSGSQVMHMLTVMIVGLAMGATVTIGRYMGADKKREMSATIGNTVTLFMVVAFAATVFLVVLVKPIVNVMATPKEAVDGTVAYLTVCFTGIPFITAYNIISSVFRGMGDSKSPMYFIGIACAANILLDCLFMGVFDMGPAGAALGTTLSQTISVIVSLAVILKRDTGINLKKSDFRPKRKYMGKILRIGVPVAIQDGLIQISFILITVIANRRGLNDAAAVGIVEKVIGIFFLVPSTMLASVSALAAQNFGASKPERAKLTLWYATAIAVGYGTIVAILTQFFSENITAIFKNDPTVIHMGGQYLSSYVWDCIFAGVHFCFSGYFCAVGRSELSFVHNIASILVARIPIAYVASLMFADTLYPMGWAAPIGSIVSVLICVAAYKIISKKSLDKI